MESWGGGGRGSGFGGGDRMPLFKWKCRYNKFMGVIFEGIGGEGVRGVVGASWDMGHSCLRGDPHGDSGTLPSLRRLL